MNAKVLVGALVAAGVIGSVGAIKQLDAPFSAAHAATTTAPVGVAAPAANPGATMLPLNGFSDLVKKYVGDKLVKRIVIVPGRLINVVV